MKAVNQDKMAAAKDAVSAGPNSMIKLATIALSGLAFAGFLAHRARTLCTEIPARTLMTISNLVSHPASLPAEDFRVTQVRVTANELTASSGASTAIVRLAGFDVRDGQFLSGPQTTIRYSSGSTKAEFIYGGMQIKQGDVFGNDLRTRTVLCFDDDQPECIKTTTLLSPRGELTVSPPLQIATGKAASDYLKRQHLIMREKTREVLTLVNEFARIAGVKKEGGVLTSSLFSEPFVAYKMDSEIMAALVSVHTDGPVIKQIQKDREGKVASTIEVASNGAVLVKRRLSYRGYEFVNMLVSMPYCQTSNTLTISDRHLGFGPDLVSIELAPGSFTRDQMLNYAKIVEQNNARKKGLTKQ